LIEKIKAGSEFKDVRFGFMEYQGSPNIREVVEKAQGEAAIVVTVNSMGTRYVDDLIAERLEGLNYTYNGKGSMAILRTSILIQTSPDGSSTRSQRR